MKRIHLVIACLVLTASLLAQTSPAPAQPSTQDPNSTATTQSSDHPASASHPDKTDQQQGASNANANGTSNDRLFFALPNFLTLENASNVPPLTAGGKFKAVARGAFDPIQAVWYTALSGISQAENSEPGFGQGAEGYGKRWGAYAADGTIENFMVGAIFPSVLHQDPRYFQSGQGSFMHRTGYAVSRAFITRSDSKTTQFNYSEVFGSALASAISTYSYHPKRTFYRYVDHNGTLVPEYWPSDRTLTNTASVWGTQVGYDTLTFVIKEFWPDIRRKITKKRHEEMQSK